MRREVFWELRRFFHSLGEGFELKPLKRQGNVGCMSGVADQIELLNPQLPELAGYIHIWDKDRLMFITDQSWQGGTPKNVLPFELVQNTSVEALKVGFNKLMAMRMAGADNGFTDLPDSSS